MRDVKLLFDYARENKIVMVTTTFGERGKAAFIHGTQYYGYGQEMADIIAGYSETNFNMA